MRFFSSVMLGLGLLSSLGAAITLPPKGPEWIADMKEHINEVQDQLNPDQIEALNDALALAVSRDEKLAPQMKEKMINAFGKEESVKLLTWKRAELAYCECVPQVDYTCGEGESCVVGGCESLLGRCVSTFPSKCTGLCF